MRIKEFFENKRILGDFKMSISKEEIDDLKKSYELKVEKNDNSIEFITYLMDLIKQSYEINK